MKPFTPTKAMPFASYDWPSSRCTPAAFKIFSTRLTKDVELLGRACDAGIDAQRIGAAQQEWHTESRQLARGLGIKNLGHGRGRRRLGCDVHRANIANCSRIACHEIVEQNTWAPAAACLPRPNKKENGVTWLVQARLVNDPFSDSALFVDFRFGRRALLFDLGDVTPLSARELLRVTHAFVSHTHMDHFAGFDRLLRVCLHRVAPLYLTGPVGFLDQVEHKLRAYNWNLLDAESFDFRLTAAEFDEGRVVRACEFCARDAFHRRDHSSLSLPPGMLLDEEEFRVESVVLDHGTPCLALAFQEKLRINVWKEGLDLLRLPVGPWLNEAKRAVRRRAPDDSPILVRSDLSIPLGVLKQHALRTARGHRIAYVVDSAFHESNIAKIVELARGADQLFIETAFLDKDAELAAKRRHLTAAQAGALARNAGVSRVVPLHFSARYIDQEDELRRELEVAWRG
jgi:ribonuclease Z